MKGYEVGYGKPPREHRFKKGVCPNPAGRGKRQLGKPGELISSGSIGAVTRDLLAEMQKVTLRGCAIWMSRQEAILYRLVRSAVAGDVDSAAQLLDLLDKAQRENDVGPIVVRVSGGLSMDTDKP